MKIYQVGGSVRDMLLGRDAKDRDYVVVGATAEEMLALGYEQVGASFPVFLKDGCEYALARTERKTGAGYKGFDVTFDPSVTLEDDLIRRDLTINAMAIDPDTGDIIDPYGGQRDLAQGILRHVSEAFEEDPVRVLRTARFAARYGFEVAPETIDMMRGVVHELAHVPKERIWAEMEKGLMEDNPDRMFDVLCDCGALDSEVLRPFSGNSWTALNMVLPSDPLEVRFTIVSTMFMWDDYDTYRIPTHVARISKAYITHHDVLMRYNVESRKVRLAVIKQLRLLNDVSSLALYERIGMLLVPTMTYQIAAATAAIMQDVARLRSIDYEAITTNATSTQVRELIERAQLDAMV